MFTITFWKAAGERAIRAFAFALTGTIGVGAAFNDVEWARGLSVAGVAAILSVLASITINSATGTGPAVLDSEQTVAKDEIVVPVEIL